MNDLGRLLEGEGNELERLLLDAGKSERPNAERKQQAALALAAATSIGLWSRVALAAKEPFQSIGAAAVGKVAVVAALAGGAGAVWLARDEAPSRRAEVPAPAVATQTVPSTPLAAPAPPPSASSAPAARAVPTSAPAVPSVSRAGALQAEIRAIDEARAALSTPNRALALLDAYAQSYPNGRLKQEAFVLRVQALVAAGRREQAAGLVRRFNAEHPNSPYAQRLSSLVGSR